ncbi:6-hydroxymethylpterin diphosphokinase MptE-like protein [Paenibacillus sp. KS-LC4]|uniref:motility associated factor glycosyltransferase family protein n=1 Tax=Paenibacillus sp. KS-LC4 TaxID=2979727 RepID=UPI0030D429FA
MLLQNLTILKEHRPDLFQPLHGLELLVQADPLPIDIQHATFDNLICSSNGQTVSLHNPTSASVEASQILLKVEKELKQKNHHVIFYGVGLGHHIKQFAAEFPKVPYSIFEPSAKIMHAFLSSISLLELNLSMLRNISIGSPNSRFKLNEIKSMLYQIPRSFSLITLPSYLKIFEKSHRSFISFLQDTVEQKQLNLRINHHFEKKWITNSFENFEETINTPSLFDFRSHFHQKPVLLVSAGPSLQDEIENLREIKKARSAFILSVGSAINSLIEFGIVPDAAFTYDPGDFNKNVFTRAINENQTPFPMVFGTSVGKGTITPFPWTKIHLPMSQDMLYGYYINGIKKTPVINDASSVAIVVLQALMILNCSSIILVGQNFAYRDNDYYAAGVPYGENKAASAEQAVSVDGDILHSTNSFNAMRREMEYFIKIGPPQTVINTTRRGAKINGAPFQNLSSVMSELLVPDTIDNEWYLKPARTEIPISLLKQKHNQMLIHANQITPIFTALQRKMFDIKSKPELKKFQDFDQAFKALQDNLFFKFILHPLSRVKYEILYSTIVNIKVETDITIKANLLLYGFGEYLHECYEDYKLIHPYFQKLNESINNFIPTNKE